MALVFKLGHPIGIKYDPMRDGPANDELADWYCRFLGVTIRDKAAMCFNSWTKVTPNVKSDVNDAVSVSTFVLTFDQI